MNNINLINILKNLLTKEELGLYIKGKIMEEELKPKIMEAISPQLMGEIMVLFMDIESNVRNIINGETSKKEVATIAIREGFSFVDKMQKLDGWEEFEEKMIIEYANRGLDYKKYFNLTKKIYDLLQDDEVFAKILINL